MYVIGGATTFARSDITKSGVLEDHSLEEWSPNIIGLPFPNYWLSSAIDNNFLYLLGGTTFPPATSHNSTLLGTLSVNQINSLSNQPFLNNPTSQSAAVISNSKLYLTGGFNENSGTFTYLDKSYFATVNQDGSLESWDETTPLPTPLFGHGMIATGTKIIVIGGWTTSGAYTNKVYEAEVQPEGALGSWTEVNELPIPIYRASITQSNTHVFVVGGRTIGHAFINDVYYAEILENGSLGPWQQSEDFPTYICCGSLAISETHIYHTGGVISGTGYTNSVFYTPISDIVPPSTNLIVPDLKQNDPLWKDNEYDTASEWSSTPSIERWGCALTSASMVLSYHGHSINPGILNSWLNGQTDGYLRNGLLNWLAISRYSKLNSSQDSPSLEFSRLTPTDDNLNTELESERPPIVRVPGHFVVVTGKNNSDYLVNDPASTNTILSDIEDDRNGDYSQINTYTPSNTDLSYLMFLVDRNVLLQVYDPTGNEIVDHVYVQDPIENDSEEDVFSGEILNEFLYAKPQDGIYKVVLSGEGNFSFDSYLYDENGGVKVLQINGVIDDQKTYFLYYSEDNQFLFDQSLLDLLQIIISGKDRVANNGIYNFLLNQFNQINKLVLAGKTKQTQKALKDLELQIVTFSMPHLNLIYQDFATELTEEIVNLQNNL